MDSNNNINELIKIHDLSLDNPKELIIEINRIRKLLKEKKVIPSKLESLSKFVQSSEQLTKKGFPEYVLLDEYFLSYATSQKFAIYRANKIFSLYPNESIIDVCCGSGLQLIEFCKLGIKTIGLENDPQRYWLAKINVNLAFYNKYISKKPELYLEDALSSNATNLGKDFDIVFCDSFRKDKIYSPTFNEILNAYKNKHIIYELIPTENISDILSQYSFLKDNSEIEYYGEKDRCSRLTVYKIKKDIVSFYQNDDYLNLHLSYKHDEVEKNKTVRFSGLFPKKEFIIINKCIIDNYFTNLLSGQVFMLDKRRYLLEATDKNTSKKIYDPLFCAESMHKIESYLRQNYLDNYYITLRFEIDPKEYWNFMNSNGLKINKESKTKISLFKYKDMYYLALEK
jgi:16S rRNA G966 N2-methylase RsmD